MESSTIYRRHEEQGEKRSLCYIPCTPPPTLETFSERISLSTRSSIEIAGLLKKNYDDDDDTEFVKSRVSRFSRRAPEAHTTLFGMRIAGYWPVSDLVSFEGLGRRSRRVFRQFLKRIT